MSEPVATPETWERSPATAVEPPALVTPAPPTIRVRHLWHRFANRDVLRDVTFDVGAGEIFGFIGPNGAGKTTTIRVMATLLEPMAGRVEIDGIDVTLDPDAVRKVIGYMPDHAGVYDRITVREYLEFFADSFRVPSISVVDAVLELTDLGKLQDRLVAEMSKGMKQRLQLARILLHDPKVLILDEPASDLDPRARIEIRDLLLELRGLGKTIFLSSHILTELSDVCTSIGILERGRLVVAGPIHEISARLEAIRAAEAHGHAPPPRYVPPGVRALVPAQGAPASPVMAGAPQHAPAISAPVPAMDPSAPVAPPQPHVPAPIPPTPNVRRVKLRVLGNPEAAAYFLRGGPGIVEVSVIGGVVHVGYQGTETKIAEMVTHLVHRNIGIVGVEPERNELERIFLEVTRGDVQ
ncbi:ATP-binding cassette domain-containing protein [Polyangium jinanense]|uniref:ATP-binding cassette domain-containing protein n=1 Tax=Polyangium jinanense TaxID=2829994 RepID=A0A9X3XD60_9BACT|nr:ATP-binding cassette domain-containing protein [Polyangium jinanense]MDC3956799.1 ATP-binding cassette domain-containing protein [Polyangium jinanense]MDC3987205.1 ATP-binding cassette domain-containing protein [Polyangium jinanense]